MRKELQTSRRLGWLARRARTTSQRLTVSAVTAVADTGYFAEDLMRAAVVVAGIGATTWFTTIRSTTNCSPRYHRGSRSCSASPRASPYGLSSIACRGDSLSPLSVAARHTTHGVIYETTAHHYDPSRAAFTDFDPFWEFVSGPLNAAVQVAGHGNAHDATFGPQVVYEKFAPSAEVNNPAFGYQFFGEVAIDAATEAMTVRLRDVDGAVLHTTEIPPER